MVICIIYMTTIKQKLAVKKMVENGGRVGPAMIEAGYSENTAHTPQKLTESEGFKELMKEYGLTEGLVIKALVEDIELKPQNRKSELELGAKILNLVKDRLEVDNPNQNKTIEDLAQEIRSLIEEVKK